MLIALDAMGGDSAPEDPVRGAVEAVRDDGTEVLLVGQRERIEAVLDRDQVPADVRARLAIEHADEVVGMHEPAITPIRKKRRSSIRIGTQMVREGRAGAFVSAGNTGAVMIAAKMVIGTSPGVDRPALGAVLPNVTGRTLVVDVGANVDAKPEQLRQFAVMGHFYAHEVFGIEEPRLGLLSIGEEEGKGNDSTRETFELIEASGLNFIGNAEGGDIFRGTCDVMVCDGFVGNVLLKSAETMAELMTGMLKEELDRYPVAKVGMLLAMPAVKAFRKRLDYSEYGGAPLLGLEGGCFIAHGRSNANAIKNAIRRAVEFCEHDTARKISDQLERLHRLESADGERLDQPPASEVG